MEQWQQVVGGGEIGQEQVAEQWWKEGPSGVQACGAAAQGGIS